ncbi:hypothetical protein ScPMuIL_009448 [Solemya velum]
MASGYTDSNGGPYTITDYGTESSRSVSQVSLQSSSEPRISSSSSRNRLYEKDENQERGNWSGRFDFILSLLGYCVGLGNIWRFPYMVYRNGGGAFLIPFILMMAIIGVPLFYMETALGQFCSCGPLTVWKFAPLFKGVGFAMIIVGCLVSIYYNMIIAWSMFYVFSSFTSTLPWSSCNEEWNTKDCMLLLPNTLCDTGIKYTNGSCFEGHTFVGLWNVSAFTQMTGRRRKWPSEEYWNNYVLGINESEGIGQIGLPRWSLVLSLLLAWVVCFLCIIRGIKTSGKVVYFTAIFPYVVLVILFFRGVTLDDAGDGIYFYVVPRWEKLIDASVWRDAANQVFYSLGPAWGGLIALSSYNRFHNNVFRDSIIVAVSEASTSIFGGFVIFSYLGHMAGKLNVKVEDVATNGAGLAFVVYPEAVNNLPLPTLWSILFFCMLITLGLDSQFVGLEAILTSIVDQFPTLRPHKTFVILAISIVFFLLGLPMTTPGGMYMLQLMDHYSASWSLMLIGLTEVVAISYCYGINRFFEDIKIMLGSYPFIWWKICLAGLTPVFMVFILVFAWVDYEPVIYGDYKYPKWADSMGWMMALASVLMIPMTMVYKVHKEDDADGVLSKLRLLITPTRTWGPALVKHRKLVDYIEDFVVDPWSEKKGITYTNYAYESQSDLKINESSSYLSVNRSRISMSNISNQSHVSFESTV